MKKLSFLLLLFIIIIIIININIVSSWKIIKRADKNINIQFRISLYHKNINKLKEILFDISDPSSLNYANYLLKDEVDKLVCPSHDKLDQVITLLNNLDDKNIKINKMNCNWLEINTNVDVLEKFLSTKVHVVHKDDDRNDIRLKVLSAYQIPSQDIEVVHGDIFMKAEKRHYFHSNNNQKVNDGYEYAVIPETIYNLYNIDRDLSVITNATQCVVEYSDDNSYSPSDLTAFMSKCNLPKLTKKVNHVGPFDAKNPDGESTLDIQYILSTGMNATTTFWTMKTGWILDFAQDLDQLAQPPLVNSQSWGSNEDGFGPSYNKQVDEMYMKLGVRGVTMLAASGDQGAIGGNGQCNQSPHYFNPGYPAASNYVLSVGATGLAGTIETFQGKTAPEICSELGLTQCARNATEELPAVDNFSGFNSGGGFSLYNPRLKHQEKVIEEYMNNPNIPKPPTKFFNSSNRCFPDISANGLSITIYNQGSPQLVDGTSASTPIIGGIITLINDLLIQNNHKPVGYVNPLLYQMASNDPSTIRSIGNLKTNNNDGCQYGYTSNPLGYDPVTGLGTLHVGNVLKYIRKNILKQH